MARLIPAGTPLSPSGIVIMAPCGRRGVVVRKWRKRGTCTWCGRKVQPPRKTWCSDACVSDYLTTQPDKLRDRLFKSIYRPGQDPYYPCAICQVANATDMDHVRPIIEGGHPFSMENLRPLCKACHKSETAALAARRAAKRKKEEK